MTDDKRLLDSSEDGDRFIWVNYLASTEIGRFLCTKLRIRWTHPIYGDFESVEGFRQWLRCNKDESLRRGYGTMVARRGDEIYRQNQYYFDDQNLKQEVALATLYKIDQYNTRFISNGGDTIKENMRDYANKFKVVSIRMDAKSNTKSGITKPGMVHQSKLLNKIALILKDYNDPNGINGIDAVGIYDRLFGRIQK